MKFRHLIIAVAVSGMALTSCQEKATPEIPVVDQETYTVKLACAGEIDVTHKPLTKSTSNDLYGIQVYYAPVSGGSYRKYAYGLFDEVSDISLELIADYKYKFVVDMIVDGKNAVYSSNMNTPEQQEVLMGYGNPFRTHNQVLTNTSDNLTPINNELVITQDVYFESLGEIIQLPDGVKSDLPKGIDVYYGEQEGYIPEEDGATITINMKRMIFGLKVLADVNQGVVNGALGIQQLEMSNTIADRFSLTAPSNLVYEATYAYADREYWYKYEVQNQATTWKYIDFEWVKDENTTLKLDYKSIDFIRMKQTIVNVTFYEDEAAGNTKVSMVFDDLEMSENEVTYTLGDDQEEYEW